MSDDLDSCQYPDCGCDGARLCNARNGPNERDRLAEVGK